MKVLITLGPTQEPIDAVRYITNASSGKMGAALAEEAAARGYKVTIVSGPVNISLPEKTKTIKVRTAEEMTKATLKELATGFDILISAAAIADYTPIRTAKEKIRSGYSGILLDLKPTRKLTREARKSHPKLFIVAFKAEHDPSSKELYDIAYEKLKKEKLNLIAGNDVEKNKFGSDYNEITLINRDGDKIVLPENKKEKIAQQMWDLIEKEYGKK